LQLRTGRRYQEAKPRAPNNALYGVGSAGTRGGETTLYDRTLQPASLDGDVQHPKRSSSVQALPTLQPYVALLRLRTPTCCGQFSQSNGSIHPVTLDTRLTWSAHIDQMRKRQKTGILGPLLNRRSGLSIKKGFLLYKPAYQSYDGLRVPRLEVRRPVPYQETIGVSVQVSSHCYQCTLVQWQQENSR
jgi:hypothetical protein